MKWTQEAESAVSRVPFFVRRRVRKRVEEEARTCGAAQVTLDHVLACQRKYMKTMDDEVKGHRLETCFGPSGCPNRTVTDDALAPELEELLAARNLRAFLQTRVQGPLKLHHEFRVTLADCPNACSRPQITDIGIIGAVRPRLDRDACTGCGACVEACQEGGFSMDHQEEKVQLDLGRCVQCGQCLRACPADALAMDAQGYRVLLGGKLGRHPQLARELEGLYTKEEVLRLVNRCLDHYMRENVGGERFGEILNRTGPGFLADETPKLLSRKKSTL